MITIKAFIPSFNDLRAFLEVDIMHNKSIDNPGLLHLKKINYGCY